MNAQCHTRGQTLHMSMLEAKTFTASTLPPPPQMDRSQSMSADCKIMDHSISVWVNQLCCMTFPAPQYGAVMHTVILFFCLFPCSSVLCNDAYSCFLFVCLNSVLIELSVSLSALNEETIEMAEKTIKAAAEDKWVQVHLARWHIFHGTDTTKPGISVLPLFCRPCCVRVETGSEQKLYFKKVVHGPGIESLPPPPTPPPGIFGDSDFWIAWYVSFQYLLVCKMNYSAFRDYLRWYIAA